jgi:hypothetical protein
VLPTSSGHFGALFHGSDWRTEPILTLSATFIRMVFSFTLDNAVDAELRDNPVTGLDQGDQLRSLLAFLLRTDQKKIEDHEDKDQRYDRHEEGGC